VARNPKGVIFDFGNVLYRVDYEAMAQRLAGERASSFLAAFVGAPVQIAYETGRLELPEVLRQLRDVGFPTSRRRFLDAYLAVFSPIPGMRALLARLARHRPLGLLSNTSRVHAQDFIETTREFRCFRARAYSFELGCMKPDPRTYRTIAHRLGLPPEDLVYVDDVEPYARAATSEGMVGVRFLDAPHLAGTLLGQGFSELEELVA